MINVNQVKAAYETIRDTKRNLSLIVKRYLETNSPLAINNMQEIPISDEKVRSFVTSFKDQASNLDINVNILCRNLSDCIYTISCDKLGISYYWPGAENSLTAQGESSFCYQDNTNTGDGQKCIITKIRFRDYGC